MARFLVCGVLVLPLLAPAAGLAQPVTIDHQEVGCIVAGKFPKMNACFAPASAAKRPRVYFRPETTSTWYYVEMTSDAPCFTGVLLRPNKSLVDKKIFYYVDVAGGDARTPEFGPTVVAGEGDCKSTKPIAPLSATGPAAVFPSLPAAGFITPASAAGIPVSVVAGGVAAAAVAGGVVVLDDDDDGGPTTTQTPGTVPSTNPPATSPTTTLPPVTTPGVNPLVVACQAAPRSGDAPLRVSFATFPNGGTGTYTFEWSFGDGGSNTNPNPSHTFTTAGVFNATVVVRSGDQVAACSRPITVTTPPPPATPKLTVSLTGSGTGTVTGPGISCNPDCSETYPLGTEVTLTATPDKASTFIGWSGDCSGTGTCKVTMTADKSVTAKFEPTPSRTLTVQAGFKSAPSTIGTVSSSPAGIICTWRSGITMCTDTATYPDGTPVTLFPVLWGGACSTATGSTCMVLMDADKTVDVDTTALVLVALPPVALSTELVVPDGEGQVVMNGRTANAVRPGLTAMAAESRRGTNHLEAMLVRGAGKPGTWRFDFSGQSALKPGSLRVVAGTAALITNDAVVFRLQGKPGERIVFTFEID